MHVDEALAKARELLPCWCVDDYKKRNLAQPDCPQCNFAEDVAEELRKAYEARASLADALVNLWNHGAEGSALDVLDKYVPGWRDK